MEREPICEACATHKCEKAANIFKPNMTPEELELAKSLMFRACMMESERSRKAIEYNSSRTPFDDFMKLALLGISADTTKQGIDYQEIDSHINDIFEKKVA